MTEYDYYTVVFAVSRSIGCMTHLVLARALGFPIERPGSVTMQWIKDKFDGQKTAAKKWEGNIDGKLY